MKKALIIVVGAGMLAGCATMERLGLPTERSKTKAGIRLALDKHGYGSAMSDSQISQVVDWTYEDWQGDKERQAFANALASEKQNEATILSFASKYVSGGNWHLPIQDRPATEMDFTMVFGWHPGKKPVLNPTIVLRSAKLLNGKIHLDTDSIGQWSKRVDNGKELHGWIVRVMADGMAGSFDGARAVPHPRDLHNIEAGDHGHPQWSAVEYVFLMNNEGTERTNMVLVEQ
ncbi:MAG: hypothetical protein ACYSW8_31755 [Planctomycetota bacterium]|jgi:hypothetical protein